MAAVAEWGEGKVARVWVRSSGALLEKARVGGDLGVPGWWPSGSGSEARRGQKVGTRGVTDREPTGQAGLGVSARQVAGAMHGRLDLCDHGVGEGEAQWSRWGDGVGVRRRGQDGE